MYVFETTESNEISGGNALISLRQVIQRLRFLKVDFWSFREMNLLNASPFKLSVEEFERLTKELKNGFLVHNEDFQCFLSEDFQILDGIVSGFARGQSSAVLELECVDSSKWIISTCFEDVASIIAEARFQKEERKG